MRCVFKVVYGEDHKAMFEWSERGFWPKATISNEVIEGIKKSKKDSLERRILQEMLHSSFTMEELKRFVEEHEHLMKVFIKCDVSTDSIVSKM